MAADKYPLPEYAVSVWVAGDSLMVAFPGTVSEQGHTIKLPASAGGLQAAVNILKDRARAQSLRIGNKGTPTQWDTDKVLAHWGRMMKDDAEDKVRKHEAKMAEARREKIEADEFLKELGL